MLKQQIFNVTPKEIEKINHFFSAPNRNCLRCIFEKDEKGRLYLLAQYLDGTE